MVKSQAADRREGLRIRAWELKQEGWKQRDMAPRLWTIAQGAVSQWLNRGREGGVEGLRRRPPPGAPLRLREDQRARLPELLARGVPAYDLRGDVWTCARVATMIYREVGVGYHPARVSRLLKRLRLTFQKPIRRADEQDEDARRSWEEERQDYRAGGGDYMFFYRDSNKKHAVAEQLVRLGARVVDFNFDFRGLQTSWEVR